MRSSPEVNWLRVSGGVSLLVIAAFTLVSVVQYELVKSGYWQPGDGHAASGDMFGMVNALASALAFALFIVTLRMQATELREQREQFQKMACAQAASDEKMQLQTYLNALTLESDNRPCYRTDGALEDRLDEIANKVWFGRKASWVRCCIEADLAHLPRPASPDWAAMQAGMSHMHFWRKIARFGDEAAAGTTSPALAIQFARELAPLFQSEFWRRLPRCFAKEAFDQLVAAVDQAPTQNIDAADDEGFKLKMHEAIQPIQSKFGLVVAHVFLPEQWSRAEE